MPLRRAEAPLPGGEGCQWPLALAADSAKGQFLLFGTDVGGAYRSHDGGKTWTPANIGSNARGACAFAIDPRNPSRALMVGANSLPRPEHGLYLSRDGARTWRHVLPFSNYGYRDVREQVAFDPTSAEGDGPSQVAYWSAEGTDGPDGKSAKFFRSSDAGETWEPLEAPRGLGAAIVKIHPAKGWVYLGGRNGLWRSRDRGSTWDRVFSQPVHGLDVVPTLPETLFVATPSEIYRSDDGGQHFRKLAAPPGVPRDLRGGLLSLKASPAKPNRLAVSRDEGDYNWQRYVSHDGGSTWQRCNYETSDSFVANNNRPGLIVWHPTNPDVAWSFGGDFITRSDDGGRTWKWSNHGYTGIMMGRSFNFNTRNPDWVLFPSQDYDAAFTTNGGASWKPLNFSGHHWGGFLYGGYVGDERLLFAGNRQSWEGPTELRISRDGGATVVATGMILNGIPIGYGDPDDEKVLFFGNLRSADRGLTWQPMNGCAGVFTHVSGTSGARSELIGLDGNAVVVSADGGQNWSVVGRVDGPPAEDVAWDRVRNRFLIANRDRLLALARDTGEVTDLTPTLPADQTGARRAWSVAADPGNPDVFYVCGPANVYMSDASVFRTRDGAQTWEVLTRNLRGSAVKDGPDGGREAFWVRVHPRTREAWFGTVCFGIWKIAPPETSATDTSTSVVE